MIMSRRRPLRRSGPSFNHAKTDPIALWINQESRHEALKHYIVREPELLKRHEELYNVRLPAHIDFTRDTVSFGGKRVEISEASCLFLSRSEMDKVAHLEWTTYFTAPMGENITQTLNHCIPLYPNLEDIFVHIKCNSIEGDQWQIWHSGPDYTETGSVAIDLQEARRVGEEVLEQFEKQRREEGRLWKRPLLVLVPSTKYYSSELPIKEVRQLVGDFRCAPNKSLLPEQ
jgi:hypothetical protein